MKKAIGLLSALALIFGGVAIAHAQTVAELQALIVQINQQITQLEQQLAARRTGLGGSGSCPLLARSLRTGLSGTDVTSLQQFLAADTSVYPEGKVSGYFGALTEYAVQRWQVKYNVVFSGTPATTGFGAVGPATRAAIARMCALATVPVTPPIIPTPTVVYRSCIIGNILIPHGQVRTFYLTNTVAFGSSCQGTLRTCNDGILGGNVTYSNVTCTAPTTGRACVLPDGTQIAHGNTPTLYKQSSVLSGQSCTAFSQIRTCNDGNLNGNTSYYYTTCTVQTPGSCTVVASTTASTTIAHNTQKYFYSQETVPYTNTCDDFKQLRVCADSIISVSNTYKYPLCSVIPARSCTLDYETVAHGSSHTFYSSRTSSGCSGISQSRSCTDGALSGSGTYQYSVCAKTGQRYCLLDGKYVTHNATSTFYSQTNVPFGNTCSQFTLDRHCSDGTLSGNASYSHASCSAANPASCTLDGKTLNHTESATFYSVQTPPAGEMCGAYGQTRYCNDGALSGSSSFQYQSCN